MGLSCYPCCLSSARHFYYMHQYVPSDSLELIYQAIIIDGIIYLGIKAKDNEGRAFWCLSVCCIYCCLIKFDIIRLVILTSAASIILLAGASLY